MTSYLAVMISSRRHPASALKVRGVLLHAATNCSFKSNSQIHYSWALHVCPPYYNLSRRTNKPQTIKQRNQKRPPLFATSGMINKPINSVYSCNVSNVFVIVVRALILSYLTQANGNNNHHN